MKRFIFALVFIIVISSDSDGVFADDKGFSSPKLNHSPYLHLNMEKQQIDALVILDRIYKQIDSLEYPDGFFPEDTRGLLFNSIILSQDYDPLIFARMMEYYSRNEINPDLYKNIRDFIYDYSEIPVLDYSLVEYPIIVRIKIESTDNSVGKTIIRSKIIELIKGKALPVEFDLEKKIIDCGNDKYKFGKTSFSQPGDSLNFYYDINDYRGGDEGKSAGMNLTREDGSDWIEAGNEYIVFLDFDLLCENSESNVFTMSANGNISWNYLVFQVKGGLVVDDYDEFGFGKSIGVDYWIEKLKLRIDNLSKGTLTGIGNVSEIDGSSIFPNPANSKLFVNFPEEWRLATKKYQIVNIAGQVICTGEIDKDYIDINRILGGAYILRVFSEKGTIAYLFVKS
jgi:hypothetical protein